MWRKIHSNRDPRDTLYSEVRKEFADYFLSAENASRRMLNAYPKLFLLLMVFIIIVSGALSFTVFRHPEKKENPRVQTVNPVSDGFSKILETTEKIKLGIRLKKEVDSISSKKALTSSDSLTLESALDSLQKTQHQ